MNVIELNNDHNSLNKIESFIEAICDEKNIGETFLGNILIAISELVNIIESQKSDVRISFLNEPKKFLFKFSNLSDNFKFSAFKPSNNSDIDDSLFMINALCDDLEIDYESNSITLTFLNTGVDDEVSNHRKAYLSKFLNQRIRV